MGYIVYRSIAVNKEDYFNILESLKDFTDGVKSYFGIEKKELRWYHYKEYCENEKGYIFDGFEFKKSVSHKMGGNTMVLDDNTILISYNTNVLQTRQNFTQMHEIYHANFDIKLYSKGQNFYNLIQSNGYTSDEQILELKADLGASILMVSDEALIDNIIRGYSFSELCDIFEISKSALELRIKNFLIFNLDLSFFQANILIEKYKLKNDSKILQSKMKVYRIVFDL